MLIGDYVNGDIESNTKRQKLRGIYLYIDTEC